MVFLFEGLSPQKTKQMVDQKWLDIVNEINSLGMGSARGVFRGGAIGPWPPPLGR